MTTTSRNARIAGFLYLLLAIAGPLRFMYIPDTPFAHGSLTQLLGVRLQIRSEHLSADAGMFVFDRIVGGFFIL